jgi:hypothetical protein
MDIRPTPSGQTRNAAADRLKEPAQNPVAPSRPSADSEAPARADRAELSDAARELTQRPGPGPAAIISLPAARMRQVLQRLSQGYYERPEVRDEVLRRMSPDLASGTSER